MPVTDTRTSAGSRGLLTLAAVAVGFAAADTYVVVLALPDMMASVGLGIDQLQRGAPVVSGFLLGYVAMLPLIGRIADVRGRLPVLVGSLLVFVVGSLVTASSYDLASMVVGRFLQGVGGGGLVPATLALVADRWPVERRGFPLGVVGAVQELGSVIGPLYGAAILVLATWRAIFWVNLAAGLLLAAALVAVGRATGERKVRRRLDLVGVMLAALACVALGLVLSEPARLTSGVTTGLAFVPYAGDTRWSTPMAIAFVVLLGLFVARQALAPHPLVDWRSWRGLAVSADVAGAVLLGLCLAGIVVAFATADPRVQVFSAAGPWLLLGSAVAAAGFAWRQRRAASPLVPAGALRGRPAWGAILVNLFVGAALIAALVDVPVFARATVYPDTQLGAALVLVRLLVAVPVGAVLGGLLVRRLPPATVAALGMAAAVVGFALMSRWGSTTLDAALPTTVPLVVAGLGFGLAIAPTNAALLAATDAAVHGLASALLVVARMVGMLVGLSALTTIGLRRFAAVSADQPPLRQICPSGRLCDAYEALLKHAAVVELHTVFWGAAACAGVAALLSLVLLRARDLATVNER